MLSLKELEVGSNLLENEFGRNGWVVNNVTDFFRTLHGNKLHFKSDNLSLIKHTSFAVL